MNSHSRRVIAFAAALAFVLNVGLVAIARGTGTAACPQEHTVEPGENLTVIGARYDMSVQELTELNAIRNPDLIPVGAVLCVGKLLPTAAAPPPIRALPAEKPTAQRVVLSVDYTLKEDDNLTFATRAGLLGMRRVFPLATTGVETFANPTALLAGLGDHPVVFFGLRQSTDGYALIEPSPLLPRPTGCPDASAPSLEASDVLSKSTKLTIETGNDVGYIFPVVALEPLPLVDGADDCGVGKPDFVLAESSRDGQFRFLLAQRADEDVVSLADSYTNQFVIESSFAHSATESSLTLPYQTGKRLVFALPSAGGAITGVQTFGDISDVRAALGDPSAPHPLFLGARWGDEGQYQLIAVGDRSLLTAIGGDEASVQALDEFCDPHPAPFALSGPDASLTRLVAYLETESGLRLPFPISRVSYVSDMEEVSGCNQKLVFGLRPDPQGEAYQLAILFSEDLWGPPGETRAQNCARWRSSSGWRYRLLSRVFGCG